MTDFDLNVVPDSDVSTGEHVEMQPADGHIAEVPMEPLGPPPPTGETRETKKKGRKTVILPDGWVVDERVRASGKLVSYKYKNYIEPRTGKKFRSLVDVQRHLGMHQNTRKKNPRKGPIRGGNKKKNPRC